MSKSSNTISAVSSEGFCLSQVTENDVILAVSHFRPQEKGEDGIPQIVVARALPVSTPYLTRLFNASLSQEIFSSFGKRDRILAQKKSTVPSSPSDFRPIVLLCFLSKGLEKLVHDQVMAFLKR